MYKIKNISRHARKFREHKTATMHFLRPGEEIVISNPPATKRTDIFEITNLELNEKLEEPKKRRTKFKGGKK